MSKYENGSNTEQESFQRQLNKDHRITSVILTINMGCKSMRKSSEVGRREMGG
jgi:hypothetical protein